MADCNVTLTNCDDKMIARTLRDTADKYDPWPSVRRALFWAIFGGCLVAAMDYGDVWICVGECSSFSEPKEGR